MADKYSTGYAAPWLTVSGIPQVHHDVGSTLHPQIRQRLAAAYAGVRFNAITICISHDYWMERNPGYDELEIEFNVSGSRADLERHRFLHPHWTQNIPPCGTRSGLRTEGFGKAWYVHTTKSGFRIEHARYSDGLDRLIQHLDLLAILGKFRRHT